MLLATIRRPFTFAVMSVLFLPMLLPVNILSSTASAQRLISRNTSNLVVNANHDLPGLDTKIDVVAGSKITITASGQAAYGPNSPQDCTSTELTNPDGQRITADGTLCSPDLDPHAVLPSSPVGELIGSIAQAGTWFAVGSSYSATISTGGRLFLLYNDVSGAYGDNSGSYQVTVTYTAAQPPYYYEVVAQQILGAQFPVDGAGASFGQYQPWVDPNDKGTTKDATHSNVEVLVTNGIAGKTTLPIGFLEYGWVVDPTDYHDTLPHLVLDVRYIDASGNKNFCIVGLDGSCDFQPVQGANYKPGDPVTVTNTPQQYLIEHSQGNWWIWYINQWIGYIPDTHWNNSFTQVLTVQWYGEVYTASDSPTPCTDMGNGTFGSKNGSAIINNMLYLQLVGGSTVVYNAVAQLTDVTNPLFYDAGHFSPNKYGFNSFTYGGPGAC